MLSNGCHAAVDAPAVLCCLLLTGGLRKFASSSDDEALRLRCAAVQPCAGEQVSKPGAEMQTETDRGLITRAPRQQLQYEIQLCP